MYDVKIRHSKSPLPYFFLQVDDSSRNSLITVVIGPFKLCRACAANLYYSIDPDLARPDGEFPESTEWSELLRDINSLSQSLRSQSLRKIRLSDERYGSRWCRSCLESLPRRKTYIGFGVVLFADALRCWARSVKQCLWHCSFDRRENLCLRLYFTQIRRLCYLEKVRTGS